MGYAVLLQPLTSLALDGALLRWGLFDAALTKVGFYFRHFVFANGTIDMGHWKDKWADAGDGMYNCTYPDGLTDHGRILQLFGKHSWDKLPAAACCLLPAAAVGCSVALFS